MNKKLSLGLIIFAALIFVIAEFYFTYRNSFTKGIELYRYGKFEEAASQFATAARFSFNQDERALGLLAISYAESGNFQRARRIVENIDRQKPEQPRTYILIAAVYTLEATKNKDAQELIQARDYIEKAWRMEPRLFGANNKALLEHLRNVTTYPEKK